MRPSLEIREFLHQYQHKLQLTFVSAKIGLDPQIKLSRQAGDTFEAVDYFNVIRTSSVVMAGYQESRFIKKPSYDEQTNLLKRLFQGPVSTIITSLGNDLLAAAGNHLLIMNGYNAAKEFINRQNQAIGENLQSTTIDSCDAPTNMGSEQ